jgi:hypothetical protein
MREQGMGEPVDLGTQEVFVGAYPFVPDGPRVFALWGGEPSSCIILGATHAVAVADALMQFAQQSAVPLAVLEDRVGDHGAWVELRRASTPEDSVMLTAFGDHSRISAAEGITLNIPLGAVTRFADALTASLRRLEADE